MIYCSNSKVKLSYECKLPKYVAKLVGQDGSIYCENTIDDLKSQLKSDKTDAVSLMVTDLEGQIIHVKKEFVLSYEYTD